MKKIHFPVNFFVMALLALASVFVGIAGTIQQFSLENQTQKADAAIILGAATDGLEISPVFRERINHGIELYRNNVVRALIFTGGKGQGKDISEAYAAKLYAMKNGVDEADIFIEENSHITQDNLKNAMEIMRKNNLASALVVSDPLHMKRAMLMAEFFGINAFSSPTQTSMYKSFKTQLPFLARETFFYIGFQLCKPFMLQK